MRKNLNPPDGPVRTQSLGSLVATKPAPTRNQRKEDKMEQRIQCSVESIVRTSEIQFFSSLHGREKRLERGIHKRDLQCESFLKSPGVSSHTLFRGGGGFAP